MAVQRLKQNSPQWHEARKREGLCLASQAAAVMNAGKFKPRNQDELLMLKRGELQIVYNKAMRHGNDHEAEARAYVEELLSIELEPVSLCTEIDGLHFWASLDGATMELDVSVEIKCPFKGRDSELWQYVEKHRKPPPYYYWQMLHQWMVSGAVENYFIVYDAAKKLALDIEFRFDEGDPAKLWQGWKSFWARYFSGERSASAIGREDEEWRNAAARWRLAKSAMSAAQQEEMEAREHLILLAGESGCQGAGVKVSRYAAKGGIDYKSIPVLQTIDLEPYRKEPSTRYRLEEM
jgi:putative phage-type endonuclease